MFTTITVKQFQRGLEYRNGRFVGEVGPGRYRLWALGGREITVVDMREQSLQIAGQEVLTADNVPVRLNVVGRFRVTDATRAIHEVTSYHSAVYEAAQLACRQAAATRTAEEFLAQRTALSEELTAATAPRAAEFGVQVVSVAIKDATLGAVLRAAYEAKLVAEQKGQAALIEARHQVAAARAEANAARVLAENPVLLRQREIEVLAKAAERGGGNTFVVLPQAVGELLRGIAVTGNPPPAEE